MSDLSLFNRVIVRAYRLLPAKRALAMAWKQSGLPYKNIYKQLRFSGEFIVRFNTGQSHMLYHYGGSAENNTFWLGPFSSFDPDTGWIWQQLTAKTEVVFDIGANIGLYSLTAKAFNQKAKVYAFEPSVNTFDKLKHNCKLNNYDVVCEQIALSNKNGTQTFYDVDNPHQYSASLSPDKLKNWEGFTGETMDYEVETCTLDSYIERNNINRMDLLKIDVEMHEPEVIEGFSKYMPILKPIVVIEALTEEMTTKLNKLIGPEYVKFRLLPNSAEPIDKFSFMPYQYNYLFFHKDKEAWVRENTTLYQ